MLDRTMASGKRPVRARILWPALGFPAVIAPRSQPPTAGDDAGGNATRCICLLVLSDTRYLSKEEAARYLRCVPWSQRGRRHIPAGSSGSFEEVDLEVRHDAMRPLKAGGPKDLHGEPIAFGGDRGGLNGIVASLTDRVRTFYERAGLRYLHEIRVSEQRSGQLANGQYQLFWNNAAPGEDVPSDEMALLLSQFAAPRRRQENPGEWQNSGEFLLREYEFEYGYLHQPYQAPRVRTEVLHPLFVERQAPPTLRIGHATDLHVSTHLDVYERNLEHSPYRQQPFNNWNRSASAVYERAKAGSDVVLLTGDLVDYGRGHWGINRADRLADDASYSVDRNWFLFYYLLVANGAYTRPVYTILGNHDWRLNPYTPFAIAGAPQPSELFHGMRPGKSDQEEQQRAPLRAAHGRGWDRIISYVSDIDAKWKVLIRKTTLWQALKSVFGNSQTADVPRYPTETTVKSIEWYLLAINPFLDYWFARPHGQQVLMLDWAEDENVLFEQIVQGRTYGMNIGWFLSGRQGGEGPKARNCLTDLQWWLVSQFTDARGPSKVIGIHAPPIGPWSDWSDRDLLARQKKYPAGTTPRGNTRRYVAVSKDGDERKLNAHPLYAIRPKQKKYTDAVFGAEANYNSFERWRPEFIRRVANPRTGVRAVLAGHIHRNGLFSVYVGDASKGDALAGQWLIQAEIPQGVQGVRPPLVSQRPTQLTPRGTLFPSGPLYVNTTSAGPRGNLFPEVGKDARADPGFTRVHLAPDGTITQVAFEPVPAAVAMKGGPPRLPAPQQTPAGRPVAAPPSRPSRVPVTVP